MDFTTIAAGDRNAFEALFRLHYKPLVGFAITYVKDQLEAEDLVQDLFFRLWNDRKKVNITSSVKAYLYTSVRNRALNTIKRKGKMRSLDEQRDEQIAEEQKDEVELADRVARVRSAIDELPPERGKVFKMSRYGGLKYQEIADELGISVKTVENQMGKALKTLRLELADLMPLITATGMVEWLFGG